MAKLTTKLRSAAGALAVDNFFRAASRLGRLHPNARPERHGVVVERDIPYLPSGKREHLLDIYRPRDALGPLPTVFYVHGGGFRILSKDTHWVMGLAFARAGYLVVNISYRLAPQHRFPAAVEDCAAAFAWLCEHGPRRGADLDRLVFAGESAGANLISALTVMTCFRRPEPWARAVFDRDLVPKAFMPYCGMLQVSDAERFKRRKPRMSTFIDDRLLEVSRAYLGRDPSTFGATLDLADPLCLLERDDAAARSLPPCFVTVGTADPLLDDTRRLERALGARGVTCEARYYPRQVHAFHAMVWSEQARCCWDDTYRFLDRQFASEG
jgi:acetyl esterase